jgi:hypothetical protein
MEVERKKMREEEDRRDSEGQPVRRKIEEDARVTGKDKERKRRKA